MHPLVGFAVCLVTALLVMQEIRRLVRHRVLQDRTDALCHFVHEPTNGIADLATIDSRITEFLDRLGLSPTERYGRTALIAGPVALAVVFVFARWEIVFAVPTIMVVGHFAFVRWKKRKLTQSFTDRLPAFLERVRRLVMIGNTLPQAFIETLATADPLVKAQMDPFVRRTQFGVSFTDCITMLAKRSDIVELHMLAAYVRTNAKFGGRVAQTLTSLIEQLENKRRLEREIKSATAETKASAAILFGLMVFLIAFMAIMNPNFVEFYASDDGRLIFLCILAWPSLGVFVMRRILTLDF